jgi:hypothetical protein
MSNMYTFIMEFCGGKYISQVHARDEVLAMQKWAITLDVSEIQWMGEKVKADLIHRVADEIPVKIQNRENVWSFLVHPLGKLCDVDIILTVAEKVLKSN